MKLYLAFLQSKTHHSIPAYSFWEYYIKNGIAEAGHSWMESEVDWAEALVYTFDKTKLAKWKANTWDLVVNNLKNGKVKPDIFLSYFYPQHIDEQAIKEIQKLGIPCVNFFCDNVREFTIVPKEFAVFDMNWVPEYKALSMYKKAGYSYINLPMPMWVEPKFREIANHETNEISFIGSKDIQRLLLFEELANKELNFSVYGNGWLEEEKQWPSKIHKGNFRSMIQNQIDFVYGMGLIPFLRKLKQTKMNNEYSFALKKRLKGKPNFDEYIRITKESQITLGVNRYPSFLHPFHRPNTYSRLRDIEAPMLGACYLTEWTEGLEEMYEIGNEIETYLNADELNEKIIYLKNNEAKRIELREKGFIKAFSHHTIENSIRKISKNLNLGK